MCSRSGTSQTQVHGCVLTQSNPADHASRGLTASQLLQGSTWLFGPEFLWKDGVFKPLKEEEIQVKERDPEVKKGNVFMSHMDSAATLLF